MSEFWTLTIDKQSPILATAIHDGHAVSDDYLRYAGLSDAQRLREEDPFTGRWASIFDSNLICHMSRFMVDLNRPRASAVYLRPEDAWGLKVWKSEAPPEQLVNSWLDVYDDFYRMVEQTFETLLLSHPLVLVLDLHSYRHKRDPLNHDLVAPQDLNPDVNIGTGYLESTYLSKFEPLFETFKQSLLSVDFPGKGSLDIRRNAKFKGGNFSRWLHARFPGKVCCQAVEFKKIFMDEWTGELDEPAFSALAEGLKAARESLPGVIESVQGSRP